MNHFSKIKFAFFLLLLGTLFYPMYPPAQADITKTACKEKDGFCQDTCGAKDDQIDACTAPDGGYCCIPPTATSTSSTGIIINTNICLDNGGNCHGSCWGITGQQKVGVCRTGGDCCARSNAIAQKIQTANINKTIVDPTLRNKALTATGVTPTGGSVPNPKLNYTLLEKIPGIDSTNLSFSAYLSAIYKLAIWIVGLCALFMFLVGAFMYMLSAANTSKMGSAKSIMQDALIGLVLALASYLILYVINPDLVNLKLPTVSMSSGGAAREPGAAAPKPKSAGDVYSNSEAVQELSSKGINVSSSGNCSDPNNSKCTSLENIPKSTIADIIALKDGTKCPVTVTGGTEVGHKSHGAGLPVVDVSENSCLEQYFSKKPVGYDVAKICSDGNSQAASYNCGNYVEAQAHFHLQFSN